MNQLILPYQKNIKKTFDNLFFEQNKNSLIIKNIQEIFKNKENQIYIYGKKSLGKTHILYSACNYFDNKKCVYLPLSEKKFFLPDIFDGFENYDLICIDDIENIFGDKEWEFAMFVLINKVLEKSKKIIFTSSDMPNKNLINLKDLESRLSWSLLLDIKEPDDSLKEKILKKTILEYEYNISEDICLFLLKNRNRDLDSLLEKIHYIGEYSLSLNKKITNKNVKSILD